MARLNTDGSLDTSFVGPSAGAGRFRIPLGASGLCKSSRSFNRWKNHPRRNVLFIHHSGVLRALTQMALTIRRSVMPQGQRPDVSSMRHRPIPIWVRWPFWQMGRSVPAAVAEIQAPTFCIGPAQSDGTLDGTFDGNTPGNANGRVRFPIGSDYDVVVAIALQQDGKIVAGGMRRPVGRQRFLSLRDSTSAAVRHLECRLDIDGDGEVLATTDALILARVALGMTGDAVLAGINVSNAPRNTWAAIRNYLVTQCGMRISG